MDRKLVVDGFKQCLQRAIDTNVLDVVSMKNFMESIFARAGYRSPKSDVDNVLILHEADIGAFIVMSAGIREIRRLYPTAHVTLVVEQDSASLAECCPYVDEVIAASFKLDGKFFCELELNAQNFLQIFDAELKIAGQLLTRRFDLALATVFSYVPTTPLLAYMSGARMRIAGYDGFWSSLLTANPPIEGKHSVDRFINHVEYLSGSPVSNRKLEAWFSPDDLNSVRNIIPPNERLIAIGLGGATARKHYPFYAELIELLRRAEPELKFVLLGGKADFEEASRVASNVDRNCVVNLVGRTTFRRTAAALRLCRLYIGNDTSTLHLAAAIGIPVLSPNCYALDLQNDGVLGAWHPYGVPSAIVCPNHALDDCKGSKDFFGCRADYPHCIAQIKPQSLFGALKFLFERIASGNFEPLFIGV